jgi:hypothetical protein
MSHNASGFLRLVLETQVRTHEEDYLFDAHAGNQDEQSYPEVDVHPLRMQIQVGLAGN